MSESIRTTIDELVSEVAEVEAKVLKKKQLVNMLCEHAGMQPAFSDEQLSSSTAQSALAPDEFYNKPLNTAVKTFLQRRKAANRGPATGEDIYEGLIAGGYDKFPGNRDEAMPGLRISLGKSSHTFVRLPNGSYGLAEWYGVKRKPVGNGKGDADKQTEGTTDENAEDAPNGMPTEPAKEDVNASA